jgi:hypothetical protein
MKGYAPSRNFLAGIIPFLTRFEKGQYLCCDGISALAVFRKIYAKLLGHTRRLFVMALMTLRVVGREIKGEGAGRKCVDALPRDSVYRRLKHSI